MTALVKPARSAHRRAFLRGAAVSAGGLLLGVLRPVADAAEQVGKPRSLAATAEFKPNAFIRIAFDGTVTLISSLPEIGQGIKTALPMVIAEELSVNWQDVVVVQGDLDPAYGEQWAGGSVSTPTHYNDFQHLGATARMMLVQAAARTWQVRAAECEAAQGAVHHLSSKRTLGYGQLVRLAAALPVPAANTVVLKDPKDYRLLGQRIAGVDSAAIVSGKPLFGIDVRLPGMLYAVYEKCPVFGGRVVSANLDAIKALPGVRHAFVIEGGSDLKGLMPGVAIVAESTWGAISARKQLHVVWSEGRFASESWSGFVAQAQALFTRPGAAVLRNSGDAAEDLAKAAKKVQAHYSYPFIAHATLEPQNCTAWFQGGAMELWAPTQNPAAAKNAVASALGLAPEKVRMHITRSGGGFGRRLSSDFVLEAAAIAHQVSAPVKLTWSREDDLRHDHYRAGGFHFLRGGLDARGKLVAWHDHFVTFGNAVRREGRPALQPGSGATLSADEFPAGWVRSCLVEQTVLECGIPMGPWRAPGSNVTAWVIQSFIDELAHAAGRDSLEFALDLLGTPAVIAGNRDRASAYDVSRMKRVLHEVAARSGWARNRWPKGRGQGVAFHFSHRGYVAQVAEVTVSQAGQLKVDRVVVVADVGAQIVNLSGAENQVQGSVIDALSALTHQELNIERGRVVQSNFSDYPMLRMPDAPPKIEVHFLKTPFPVTGLGEPAFPPLAPAVCNAIFAATGTRVRQLPLARVDLRWS